MRALSTFPRFPLAHRPTPLELLSNLSVQYRRPLYVKRDDCTGLAFGGNKVRQLEFYVGDALAKGATTLLITGAVQSNYVRCTAAAAVKAGLRCVVQLEDRVKDMESLYHESGNVLLDKLFGAEVVTYPVGEDEEGADRNLDDLAHTLGENGEHPYVVHLSARYPPLGALGYVEAAEEIVRQADDMSLAVSSVVLGSGSALTHAGFLVGFAALGRDDIRVHGVCVRRTAVMQWERIQQCIRATELLMDCAGLVPDEKIMITDQHLGLGYGRPSQESHEALLVAARREGLVLDPVYTAKAFAGFLDLAVSEPDGSAASVFVHTGGVPALFAYGGAGLGLGPT